ncbi:unnamed protein product [Owenia fusiformis]|uniref:Uncharacterized protein n=1 Tax=Owenia fusiformis TaxID=6347 RepID=A0A8J1UWU8_OWEFU|nr:unnamed protein product [Owenia fusiformis]
MEWRQKAFWFILVIINKVLGETTTFLKVPGLKIMGNILKIYQLYSQSLDDCMLRCVIQGDDCKMLNFDTNVDAGFTTCFLVGESGDTYLQPTADFSLYIKSGYEKNKTACFHGNLIDGVCHCDNGFYGEQCDFVDKDCSSYHKRLGSISGYYTIMPYIGLQPTVVMCTNQYIHLVSRSFDGPADFFQKSWNQFEYGFTGIHDNAPLGIHGNSYAFFGLQYASKMTELKDFDLELSIKVDQVNVMYLLKYFKIASEQNGYSISFSAIEGPNITPIPGNWNISMIDPSMLAWQLNGSRFSSWDLDNDNKTTTNCAHENGGGFWYNDCSTCHLVNGTEIVNDVDGIPEICIPQMMFPLNDTLRGLSEFNMILKPNTP